MLNDKTQGGSVLKPGRIELMHHRRMYKDDGRGVGEALNETENGKGVSVPGKYFMQLFDRTKESTL